MEPTGLGRAAMVSVMQRVLPGWIRGYRPAWVPVDVVAGLTLAAVAIPEVVGYTSIAGTPIATGLYTVIFPTMVFALLGSSKLLVAGADSATAAILAAGLACGVPEVVLGSLTSGDRWSDMIPARRRGCCT